MNSCKYLLAVFLCLMIYSPAKAKDNGVHVYGNVDWYRLNSKQRNAFLAPFDFLNPEYSYTDKFVHADINLDIKVNPFLTFKSNFEVDQLYFDALGGSQVSGPSRLTRTKREQTFIINDLYIQLNKGSAFAELGKYIPKIGIARTKRVNTFDPIRPINEIPSSINLGLGFKGETPLGFAILRASTFFLDTSPLSSTTATDKRKLIDSFYYRPSSASNTEKFNSYALSLDMENLLGTNINSHLAYADRSKQLSKYRVQNFTYSSPAIIVLDPPNRDERRFIASFYGEHTIGHLRLFWLNEFTYIENPRTNSGLDINSNMSSMKITYDRFHLAGSYTRSLGYESAFNVSAKDQGNIEISLMVDVYDMRLGVGWNNNYTYNTTEEMFAVRVSKQFDYELPFLE